MVLLLLLATGYWLRGCWWWCCCCWLLAAWLLRLLLRLLLLPWQHVLTPFLPPLAQVVALAELAPDSEELWILAVLSTAVLGQVEAAMQLAAEGGPAGVGGSLRQQVLAELAVLVARIPGGQAGLPAGAAERLVAACTAVGFSREQGSSLALAALELHRGMLLAGQQPSLDSYRAALAGTVHLLRVGASEADIEVHWLQLILAEHPQLAADLDDGDWDLALAGALGQCVGGDAARAAGLLATHGPLVAAASRQQRWGDVLRLAATAAGAAAGGAALSGGAAVAGDAAVAQRLAALAVQHMPVQGLEEALEPLVLALGKAGCIEEVSIAATAWTLAWRACHVEQHACASGALILAYPLLRLCR